MLQVNCRHERVIANCKHTTKPSFSFSPTGHITICCLSIPVRVGVHKKIVKFQCSFIRKRKVKIMSGNERHESYFPYIQFISEILLHGLGGQVIDIWDELFHGNLTDQLLPSTSVNSNSLLSLFCPSLRLRAASEPSPDRHCETSNGWFGTTSTVCPCHRQSRTTLNHNRECLYKP